ncbi:MAG: ABC transporter permease [Christensenellaceae bacterium]
MYNLSIPAIPAFDVLGTVFAVGTVALLAAVISVLVCETSSGKPASCMRPAVPKDNLFLRLGKRRDVKKSAGARQKREGFLQGRKDGALSFKMAVRNIRSSPCALMTVIGITGCVALLMCAFGIGDTVNNSLETEFYKQFTYDISTPYNTSGFTKKMDAMKASGEIEAFEIYKIHYMTAIGAEANKDVKVYNFSENMTMTTIDTSGGRVVMSRSVAEFLGLKEGGTFTLNSGAQSFELTLSEIVDTAITKGVFLHTDLFEDIYGTSSAWIRADNITDELIDKINEAGGTAQATSVEDMWGYVEDKVSSINAMKYTLMIFSVLNSVVVLYKLSLLNINERTRDIATLKVLGFKRGKIALSLLFEIMLLTLAGTVCGLILGYPLTYLVLSINKVEIMSFLYYLKPVSYVYSALLALLTSFAINYIFGRSLDKINMIESLKSVE